MIVNDVSIDTVKENVTNPLKGLKVAGYAGCQTVRPFAHTDGGGKYDTYDDPEFLDNFVEACGAEAVEYDPKTSCGGGSVSVMSPDKTLRLIKKTVDAAVDAGADVIATPYPLCQTDVEMYQDAINKKFGTNYKIPVVFYSQFMVVVFGMDPYKDAALHQNTIRSDKLEQMAKEK